MKRLLIFLILLAFVAQFNSQFKISILSNTNLKSGEAYIYSTDGSSDILFTKAKRNGLNWEVKYPKSYVGMMKAYFPEENISINFISENKDISFFLSSENGKLKEVTYHDEANKVMNDIQDSQRKKEEILPALYQIQTYYRPSSEFFIALEKEIVVLSSKSDGVSLSNHPFVEFYLTNYNKFLVDGGGSVKPTQSDISKFIINSNEMLETSGLMRPILYNYLRAPGSMNTEDAVKKLLSDVVIESPRGQAVLSEFIDIFDMYGMTSLKDKYLNEAHSLKCTITDRLSTTLQQNDNVKMGAKFPNYTFTNSVNTTSKSLYDIKADKKVIIFWSSACSHCEKELPELIPVYSQLKARNIEIIGLSLDTEKDAFFNRARSLPWVNDSELKGWNSTSTKTYNIHATPTFFILDSNNIIVDKPDHVNDVLQYLDVK